mmetsp:Transcript_11138/g.15456  ORF Transcript_11138/g.15456 Transcript_11138/m.15456 type:complete len:230 (+) Transcript_11138:62-751(+)
MDSVKAVVIGNSGVGKTAMQLKLVQDYFPHEHVPTTFEIYQAGMLCKSQLVQLNLWDLGGKRDGNTLLMLENQALRSMAGAMLRQRENEMVKILSEHLRYFEKGVICTIAGYSVQVCIHEVVYPKADVFVLCYSLSDAASLKSLLEEWGPEIQRWYPNVPRVLVGLREDEENKTIPLKLIEEVANVLDVSEHLNFRLSAKHCDTNEIAEKFLKMIGHVLQRRRSSARVS